MSYLRINSRVFDKNRKEAMALYENEGGSGEDNDAQFTSEPKFDTIEFNKQTNSINCFYSKEANGEDLISSDIEIPLEMDLIIEIIEHYRKKLGKLKTVLEATKD